MDDVDLKVDASSEAEIIKKFKEAAVAVPKKINIPLFVRTFADPIETPIGKLKVDTDYLLNKSTERDQGKRLSDIHLIEPTLKEPAYVVKYRDTFNFMKPFSKEGEIKGYLSVISDRDGYIKNVTSHKVMDTDIKKILREGHIVVDNVGGALRTGAKSTESLNQRPVTLNKSIAKNTKDVKTRDELVAHRYFDDVVTYAKGSQNEVDFKPKRESVARLKAQLEKRGVDKSDDVYKAEMSKLFKKGAKDTNGLNVYSKKEVARIESGNIDNKLAVKLVQDLREYAANPKYVKDRELTDSGMRAFGDEADLFTQMKLDEALEIVQTQEYGRGFDGDYHFADVSKMVDEVVVESNSKQPEIDNIFDDVMGADERVKIDANQEAILAQIDDPVKRSKMRKGFEWTKLKAEAIVTHGHDKLEIKAESGNVYAQMLLGRQYMYTSSVEMKREMRGIYNVAFNDKRSTEIRKSDNSDIIKFEKGFENINNGKGMGSLHIEKHLENGSMGEISRRELLKMGRVVREGVLEINKSSGKHVYTLHNKGVRYRVISGKKNNKKEKIITFYSDRNMKEDVRTTGTITSTSSNGSVTQSNAKVKDIDMEVVEFAEKKLNAKGEIKEIGEC